MLVVRVMHFSDNDLAAEIINKTALQPGHQLYYRDQQHQQNS